MKRGARRRKRYHVNAAVRLRPAMGSRVIVENSEGEFSLGAGVLISMQLALLGSGASPSGCMVWFDRESRLAAYAVR